MNQKSPAGSPMGLGIDVFVNHEKITPNAPWSDDAATFQDIAADRTGGGFFADVCPVLDLGVVGMASGV